ncbi:MAG: hypothetical protein J6P53_07005 [Mailhella sp.]|nr:hypothetical protein [Mailhella sp.]
MKGLLRHLSPFAPDQSGAVAALHGTGALIVVCDAGGCTGNICGFDMPAWLAGGMPVFSAGLRDMDAILGRDERLVARLAKLVPQFRPPLAAIVGTPVPAVIGTDFQALARLGEKACGIPVLALPTSGAEWYDKGVAMAQEALLRRFALPSGPEREERPERDPERIDVFGATSMDLSPRACGEIRRWLGEQGWRKAVVHGFDAAAGDVQFAGTATKALAVSPSGVRACRLLQERFGTPWEAAFPVLPQGLLEELAQLRGEKALCVHQQVLAREVCRRLQALGGGTAAQCASWFGRLPGPAGRDCLQLKEEDDLARMLSEGGFTAFVGDRLLLKAAPRWQGRIVDLPHFAVSGRIPGIGGAWRT